MVDSIFYRIDEHQQTRRRLCRPLNNLLALCIYKHHQNPVHKNVSNHAINSVPPYQASFLYSSSSQLALDRRGISAPLLRKKKRFRDSDDDEREREREKRNRNRKRKRATSRARASIKVRAESARFALTFSATRERRCSSPSHIPRVINAQCIIHILCAPLRILD